MFDRLYREAIDAFDKIIGLDLTEVPIDGSQHKAPFGGEGTGPSPVDRGKLGGVPGDLDGFHVFVATASKDS